MGIERSRGSTQNPTVSQEETPEFKGGISGNGLQIWGDVKFKADAVIQADVKGSVLGVEKIIVTEGTVVTGAVEGSDVRIEGEARGGVRARGQVWLGPKAKVRFQCQARSLRIESGAEFRGELHVG